MKIFTEKNIFLAMVIAFAAASIIFAGIKYNDYWLNNIDAVTENPILIHTQGVDVKNLQMEWGTYSVGDTPRYMNSYCKLRRAKANATYWLIDANTEETITSYQPGEYKEMPLGCTPQTQNFLVPTATRELPLRAAHRKAYWKILVYRVLPDGRLREEDYQTQTFNIN